MNPSITPTTWMNSVPHSNPSTTDIGSLRCHPRYTQNDTCHDVWNDNRIHQPQTLTVSPTSLHHEQQKQPPKSQQGVSLPHCNVGTADPTCATTPTTNTSSSVSVSIPLVLTYPAIDDIPADISVDEIFQQTNIVMGRKPAYSNTTNVHPVYMDDDNYIIAPCIVNSDDHNNDYYDDANSYNLDSMKHPNNDDLDDEELTYQYQTNPLRQTEPESQYYIDGRFDTSCSDDNADADDGDYVEEYAVPLPQQQHASSSRSSGYDLPNDTNETQWDEYHPQHCNHHRYPHSEVVPVALPELDDTSGHSSTHPDDDYNTNSNYSDNYCTPSDTMETPNQSEIESESIKQISTIEISPGKYLPLRGAKETMYAIECGFCVTIPCTICDQALICIANCELVLCPTCRIVSPNTATMLKHTTTTTTNTTARQIMNEDEDDIILRLDVKSGVGLGLQAT